MSMHFRRLGTVCFPMLMAACFNPNDVAEDTDGMASTSAGTTSEPPDPTTTATPGDSTTAPGSSSGADATTSNGSSGAPAACGDGTVDAGEECDDGNTDDGDGCAAGCTIDEGWSCDGADPSTCSTICGDGVIGAPVEQCDDSNTVATDACTDTCQDAACGDGILWEGNEACDDAGVMTGDGCDDACEIEAGFLCEGSPSACAPGIYLADGSANTAGELWVMTIDGSTVTDLGPLSVPLTAMAFHPNGTLYGVTSGGGTPDVAGVLGTIDPATATFTPIGQVVTAAGVEHNFIPDITFLGSQLVGWTETSDDLALITALTGVLNPVATNQTSSGTALTYNSATDELYLAPMGSGGTLFIVSPMGAVTAGPTLGGSTPAVKGMAYYDGLIYGMEANNPGPAGNVVTYDPMTGAMNVLAPLPSMGIDALAVYDPMNTP